MMSSVSKPRNESGFSLVELLISITIFTIVTGSIFGVMSVAKATRSVVSEKTGLNKNVRIALNLVGRDAYNAGFGYPLKNTVILTDNRIGTLLGIPNDPDTTRDTVAPIIAGDNRTLNTYNQTPNVRTDQVTFLFKDSNFNLVGGVSQPLKINAATTKSGGTIDEIVPLSGSNALCDVNDLYLVTGSSGSTLGLVTAKSGSNKIEFSNGDVLGINKAGPGGTLRMITVPASIQKVRMVTYFVTPDGTLTRREYANIAPVGAAPPTNWVDSPLIYGVQNFQIQYIMDDGTVTDNPIAGPDGIAGTADDIPTNLAAVRQIRLTVDVRSVENNTNGQPFQETQTATFSTRNLGYEAN